MIIGFRLPEGLAGPIEERVGFAGREALDGLGDPGEGRVRVNQEMDVVGHDDPRVEVIEFEIASAELNGFRNAGGYDWKSKVVRAGSESVRRWILNEMLAGREMFPFGWGGGQRAVEAPC